MSGSRHDPVLVTGATGRVGRLVVDRLLGEDVPVRAFTRNPAEAKLPSGVEVVTGDLTVHIDANPVVAHKSSAYVQELVGLVVGQGFKALIKPESWAASHAADHAIRKGLRPVA